MCHSFVHSVHNTTSKPLTLNCHHQKSDFACLPPFFILLLSPSCCHLVICNETTNGLNRVLMVYLRVWPLIITSTHPLSVMPCWTRSTLLPPSHHAEVRCFTCVCCCFDMVLLVLTVCLSVCVGVGHVRTTSDPQILADIQSALTPLPPPPPQTPQAPMLSLSPHALSAAATTTTTTAATGGKHSRNCNRTATANRSGRVYR